MSALLVDSHCHLDFPEFQGREDELVTAMQASGVGWALVAGVTLERFPGVLALAERFPKLFAAVGVHPDTQDGQEADEEATWNGSASAFAPISGLHVSAASH